MVFKKSRVQKIERSPNLADEMGALVAGLNNQLGGELYRGNRKIVDSRLLLVLVKRLQVLAAYGWASPKGFRQFHAVNQTLRRYTACALILPTNQAEYGWKFGWMRTAKRDQPFLEMSLILDILKLFVGGHIAALKQCDACGKWLFARFPHQRFCSGGACKDHFHKSNEADKKRRREWARHNYQTRKELELGSRRAAQHRGGNRNVHLQAR